MGYKTQQIECSKIIDFIVDKKFRVLRHILFCAVLLSLICYSNWLHNYSGLYKAERLFSVYIVLLAMFYTNIYVLLPRFFFKNHYVLYSVFLLLTVYSGICFLGYILQHYLSPDIVADNHSRSFYEGALILVPLISTTTTIKLFQNWNRANQHIAELKDLTLNMELQKLKNQINPHFLFNMLNSIKALTRQDSDKANAVIIKLSEFLRYQLYDNNDEKTFLKSEIEFLTNFLNLEKLRRDYLEIEIVNHIPLPQFNSIQLPPNIFTTFAENAVKHSANIMDSSSFIKIEFIHVNNELKFICTNSIDPVFKQNTTSNGLGLNNIKRRLDLLYGDTYHIKSTKTQNEYSITLNIPL